jgi:CheY-like chemotaxis protein
MRTILLLDDNAELGMLLSHVLEYRGYIVVQAPSGNEGLAALHAAATPPDLIVCDLQMPDMDGPTFLTHMKANHAWSAIPFIVISADEPNHTAETATLLGAAGYLSKPFGLDELDDLLNKIGLAG